MDVAGDGHLLAEAVRRQAPYSDFYGDMGRFTERGPTSPNSGGDRTFGTSLFPPIRAFLGGRNLFLQRTVVAATCCASSTGGLAH